MSWEVVEALRVASSPGVPRLVKGKYQSDAKCERKDGKVREWHSAWRAELHPSISLLMFRFMRAPPGKNQVRQTHPLTI